MIKAKILPLAFIRREKTTIIKEQSRVAQAFNVFHGLSGVVPESDISGIKQREVPIQAASKRLKQNNFYSPANTL